MSELPYNDNICWSMLHMGSFDYTNLSTWCTNDILLTLNAGGIVLGVSSMYHAYSSYSTSLIAEISQLCHAGVMRSIALGSTDALCSYHCPVNMCLQPVMVPVGRIALGRIFKVTGTVIDGHASLSQTDLHSDIRSIMLYTDSHTRQPETYAAGYRDNVTNTSPTMSQQGDARTRYWCEFDRSNSSILVENAMSSMLYCPFAPVTHRRQVPASALIQYLYRYMVTSS